jgi:NTP pyrophosphatase (non-canonical NTP hydrolase)
MCSGRMLRRSGLDARTAVALRSCDEQAPLREPNSFADIEACFPCTIWPAQDSRDASKIQQLDLIKRSDTSRWWLRKEGPMKVADYEAQAVATSQYGKPNEPGTATAPLLGLAAAIGSVMGVYKRYILGKIDLISRNRVLRHELGDLLWYAAVVASVSGLSLAEITEDNIAKIRKKYRATPETTDFDGTLSGYQRAALSTSDYGKEKNPGSAVPPLMGLAHAEGNIMNEYKLHKNTQPITAGMRTKLRTELGDLLWYSAVVAATIDLDLLDIAQDNLAKTRDRYGAHELAALPNFDHGYGPEEVFPRRMTIQFSEYKRDKNHVAELVLVEAQPNGFPDGPTNVLGDDGQPERNDDGTPKKRGYAVGQQVGNTLDDNSRRADGYRFHDAIHLGLAYVLGWSPNLRALLRIKRKSQDVTDRSEDGARARFLEEGLAAMLFRLSEGRGLFLEEHAISGDILDIIKDMTRGLEVEAIPAWAWRRAISQGFKAFHELHTNKGGILVADLDARTLAYRRA